MTSVILSIPGLFGSWQGNGQPGSFFPDTPKLDWLLSRASHAEVTPVSTSTSHTLAEYSYFADFDRWPESPLLLVEPIHLRADQRNVRAYGSELLKLQADEAGQLVDSLNALVLSDGLRFEVAESSRWYLHLMAEHGMQFTPLIDVLGKAIDPFLPVGVAATQWHRWMNEWQMLLFDHPVNQQRAGRNMLSVNGVWLWGEQTAVMPELKGITRLFTCNPALQGYAMSQQCRTETCPDNFSSVGLAEKDKVYMDIADLIRPLAYQDEDAWTKALLNIEQSWLVPLFQAHANGLIRQIELRTEYQDTQHCFALDNRASWRFWRKLRPLASWVQYV